MEQVTGIEPAYSAWEADTLPLSYTCTLWCLIIIIQNAFDVKCPNAFFCICFHFSGDFFRLFSFLVDHKLRELCQYDGEKDQ